MRSRSVLKFRHFFISLQILRTNYENMTDISLITMRESPIEQEENKVQFDLFFYDEADNQICLDWLCEDTRF